MLKTILLLILALIALPFAAYYTGVTLSETQVQMLTNSFYIMGAVALTCFIVSEWTGNYSQVDKLWSIMPMVYTWYFAWEGGWDTRMVIMAILVSIWGLRLTYNFWRRGGYHWIPWEGEEDYRWAELRKLPLFKTRLSRTLFNFFFISFYQQTLILLFTLPAVMAWHGNGQPLNALDLVATFLFLLLVFVETVSDQQQYEFQTEKYRRIYAGEPLEDDYQKGFIRSGLWAKVRHPNYAAEQGIWLSFYLFSVAATGNWFNASLVGVILLMLLFQGSSDFSEKITAGKYPAYAEYQQTVGRFLPKIGGKKLK